MTVTPVITTVDGAGRATVTLNRSDAHNAFDDALIRGLAESLGTLDRDPGVRVVVLASAGKNFSAGADLEWLRQAAAQSPAEIAAEATVFAGMLQILSDLRRPTVAAIQGAAYGGAVGLIACCDFAVASERARFALPEVTFGLVPAMVSPYVITAIGARQARRYMLTGETFDAVEALRVGLVHAVVPAADLDATVDDVARMVCGNGPQAVAAAKDLIAAVSGRRRGGRLVNETAASFARALASDEGREGLAALLAKRDPEW